MSNSDLGILVYACFVVALLFWSNLSDQEAQEVDLSEEGYTVIELSERQYTANQKFIDSLVANHKANVVSYREDVTLEVDQSYASAFIGIKNPPTPLKWIVAEIVIGVVITGVVIWQVYVFASRPPY